MSRCTRPAPQSTSSTRCTSTSSNPLLDMARTREVFEASTDFTLAVEEEFQLLDPYRLELTQRYTDLRAATDADPVLQDAVAGELIESEIEIRSGKCDNWGEVVTRQQEARN